MDRHGWLWLWGHCLPPPPPFPAGCGGGGGGGGGEGACAPGSYAYTSGVPCIVTIHEHALWDTDMLNIVTLLYM